MAWAALVVQWEAVSPAEIVRELVAALPPPGGSVALLEALSCLPEEAQSSRTPISRARRAAFLAGLGAVGSGVLSLLQDMLHVRAGRRRGAGCSPVTYDPSSSYPHSPAQRQTLRRF